MPRNCNECEHHNHCDSCYGGSGCVYKEVIEAKGRKKEGGDPFIFQLWVK